MSLRKVVIGTVAGATALLATAATVAASGATDTGDHFSLAKGTAISAGLKSGTKLTLVGSINGTVVTVTCSKFSAAGTIPSSGLTVALPKSPTISGCSLLATITTTGKWTLTENDAANDETGKEPNSTGDKATLTIPKGGATFKSSLLPGCVITVAPTGPANVAGAFNDATTITDNKVKVPVKGTGCTSTSSTITGTIVLSRSVNDVS